MTFPYDARLGVLPKDVLGSGDVFEEFELREVMVTGVSAPPLRSVWQEDATGEDITLAEVSGPLHKVLETTEETVGCLSDWSKSGGKKSHLA